MGPVMILKYYLKIKLQCQRTQLKVCVLFVFYRNKTKRLYQITLKKKIDFVLTSHWNTIIKFKR